LFEASCDPLPGRSIVGFITVAFDAQFALTLPPVGEPLSPVWGRLGRVIFHTVIRAAHREPTRQRSRQTPCQRAFNYCSRRRPKTAPEFVRIATTITASLLWFALRAKKQPKVDKPLDSLIMVCLRWLSGGYDIRTSEQPQIFKNSLLFSLFSGKSEPAGLR